MQYRKLGRTDMEVSVVCQGCWSIVGGFTWGEQDRSDSIAALRAALDAGINFFDTAEGYGNGESEELIAEALGDAREDVVLATKVSRGNLRPDDVRAHCEQSLRRLRTDAIDLYQIHWPTPEVPLPDTVGAMERLRDEGKVRALGVSNFGATYLRELLELTRVESNQVAYSLLWRAIEHEVQTLCVESEVSVLCYSPLCQGLLTGKFSSPDDVPADRARTRLFSADRPHARHDEPGCERETFEAVGRIREISESVGEPMGNVALAWLLTRPGVASVIAGGRNAEQVRQNARAGDRKLPESVAADLAEATEAVKQKVGTNGDMWQTDSRMEP
jgi:aryl-alcohol dehydrogenase-like predicted oxidoreductase